MSEEKREMLFEELKKAAAIYSKNKAKRVYLEEFRKSKKAILMQQAETSSPGLAVNAQEREAYAHKDYLELLKGLESAVELEQANYWKLKELEMRFEKFRTDSANRRAEMGLR